MQATFGFDFFVKLSIERKLVQILESWQFEKVKDEIGRQYVTNKLGSALNVYFVNDGWICWLVELLFRPI